MPTKDQVLDRYEDLKERLHNQEVENINTDISKVEKHIEKLRQYRTALISAIVTSKIDIRDELL